MFRLYYFFFCIYANNNNNNNSNNKWDSKTTRKIKVKEQITTNKSRKTRKQGVKFIKSVKV